MKIKMFDVGIGRVCVIFLLQNDCELADFHGDVDNLSSLDKSIIIKKKKNFTNMCILIFTNFYKLKISDFLTNIFKNHPENNIT